MPSCLKIGLIINPIAGIGGRVALKGSDSEKIQQKALELGAKPEANKRTRQTLETLLAYQDKITFFSVQGSMGADLLDEMGFQHEVNYCPVDEKHTTEQDTIDAALKMGELVDLILFAGGDGTARNILQAVGEQQLCLGIPAGCKIYSAVFSVTPQHAGNLIAQMLDGELVEMQESQVLDINEASYREGIISTRVFGEMLIPRNGGFVQSVKISGRESEELVQQDIAAWVSEIMDPEVLYVIGSGSSCQTVKNEIGIEGTLLGVDVVLSGKCLVRDATEKQILALMNELSHLSVKLILTVIGGQGILLGRGNHQVCHQVIRKLGLENLIVIASKTKIKELDGKALGIDTGDVELNNQLTGFIPVITGYDDTIIYPVGNPS